MKIFAITDNYQHNITEETDRSIGWHFLPDSSIFRAPNPYFADEETDLTAAFPSLAIRIDRLGKSVSPRFASRYTFHAALAVNLRNLTLEERLASKGLPIEAAWGYDRSLLLSDWVETTLDRMGQATVSVGLEGGIKTVWRASELRHDIADVIARVSRMNSLKMGDIILPGFHHTGLTLLPGALLSATMTIAEAPDTSLQIPIR